MADDSMIPPVQTEEGMDMFLDDATHKVKEMWEERGGRVLTSEELYKINDALTVFFDGI